MSFNQVVQELIDKWAASKRGGKKNAVFIRETMFPLIYVLVYAKEKYTGIKNPAGRRKSLIKTHYLFN